MLIRPDEHDEDVAYEDIMSIEEHEEYSLQDLVDLYYPCRVCFYGAVAEKNISTCERKETCKECKKWEALYEALNALDDREYDDMLMEDDWK